MTGNIGNNGSDIIKLATIITETSILGSSGEKCLPVFYPVLVDVLMPQSSELSPEALNWL